MVPFRHLATLAVALCVAPGLFQPAEATPGGASCRAAPGDRRPEGPEDPAVAYLRKLGWVPEPGPRESAIDVPANLTSPPFVHYQSASKAAGLDLEPLAGKTVAMNRYELGKTSKGSALFAFVLVSEGRVVGAWLATDAPVAPGIMRVDTPREKIKW